MKVSCLTITMNRLNLLKNSIKMFSAQTYINKEMIIVYHKDDNITKNYLLNLNIKKIIPIEYDQDSMNIGNKRNFGISYCTGDYIMVWDDDDLYHKDRISTYIKNIGNYDAICSNTLVMFDLDINNIYMNHYKENGWENTLLFKNLPEYRYGNISNYEDTFLLNILNDNKKLIHYDFAEYQIYIRWNNNNFNLVTKKLLFSDISNDIKEKISPLINEFYDRSLYYP